MRPYFHSFHEVYDLSYSYFSHFLLNFKRVLRVSKSRNSLVAVGLNQGDSLFGPQVYTTILTFFFIFSLFRLIHPYRLSKNNLRSDIVNISLEHSGRTVSAGSSFTLSPLYTISFGFCQAVLSLTAGLWTIPFRRFADLIKDAIKQRLNIAVLGLCLFLCL